MKGLFTAKRRMAVLLVALVALSIGASVAIAKSGPSQIKSTLHLRDNGSCPGPNDKLKHARGKVSIVNEKGAWTIVIHARGVIPGTYHIDLLDGNCVQFATAIRHFKVKSDGSGDVHEGGFAIGFQSFYLRIHDPDQDISYFTPRLKIGGNP
jgi:hypothetical protein